MTEEYTDLTPCSTCGRNFRSDVLTRHAPICQKTAQKKRRVFESGKQRATGTEIPMSKIIKVNQPLPKEPAKVEAVINRKHNWRQKHEDFIRNIRAAKQYQHAADTGAPLPPPPPPTIDPSLILCDYCGRRFNEKAVERHVTFCREKNARISGPGGGSKTGLTTKTNPYNTSDAHQKMAVRTQYQPPKPKVAASSTAGASAGAAGRAPSGGAPLRTGKTVKDYMDARELAAESRGNSGSSAGRSGMPRYSGGGAGGGTGGAGGFGAGGGGGPGGGPGAGPARFGAGGPGSGSGGALRYGGAGGGAGGGGGPSANGSGYGRPPMGGRGGGAAGGGGGGGGGGAGLSNFCHECGNKYPTGTAKFCVECGCKRMAVS